MSTSQPENPVLHTVQFTAEAIRVTAELSRAANHGTKAALQATKTYLQDAVNAAPKPYAGLPGGAALDASVALYVKSLGAGLAVFDHLLDASHSAGQVVLDKYAENLKNVEKWVSEQAAKASVVADSKDAKSAS